MSLVKRGGVRGWCCDENVSRCRVEGKLSLDRSSPNKWTTNSKSEPVVRRAGPNPVVAGLKLNWEPNGEGIGRYR